MIHSVTTVEEKTLNIFGLATSKQFDYAKIAANKSTKLMASHDKRLQEVLDKLAKDLVEYFDSGFVVATFQDGAETKNAFLKFGNDYAIEGIVSNIHDILYGQEEDEGDDDLDDGDLKKIIKDS
jgi:sulfite reductase alpha subunit-like flavoprotein